MLGVVVCAQTAPQPRNTITQAAAIGIAGPRIETSISFPLSARRKIQYAVDRAVHARPNRIARFFNRAKSSRCVAR
jgi:hypothetical protein